MIRQRRNNTFPIILLIVAVFLLVALIAYQVSRLLPGEYDIGSLGGNELRLPPVLEDTNPDPDSSEFELNVMEGQTEFISGLKTNTLGYNGSYLGPVIRMKRGENVSIRVNNRLSFPTTVHWHGLVVDGDQDGGPHQGIQPNQIWNPEFTVDQPAATLWFHPHLMGSTANQVYYGLAGIMYIDDDISERMDIPKDYGSNDFPLIIQDRSFNGDGSFDYRTSMMGVVAGNHVLINGTVNPYVKVDKGKARFRILNGSNSQNFYLRLSDRSSFQQIASDGGFLETPLTIDELFLSPGERAEIIVDFSNRNRDAVSLMNGNKPILNFNVSNVSTAMPETPESLAYIDDIPTGDNPNMRIFELQGMGINGTINGNSFDMNRIDEEVSLNETEIWIIRNRGGMMQSGGHPFHVHGTQFQIVSRDGREPPPGESGFKDTVYVDYGEEVAIKVRFVKRGIFMYHCHILEHEDGGMMGQFRVQ